jgi:quinol monooxygenase YgiN
VSVRLTALFTATPGSGPRLREVLEADARSTRADEGNERFELFVSSEDEHRLALVEQWRSQADIDDHKTHEHRNTAHAALHGEGIVESLEIWRCEPRDGPGAGHDA